jgi:tyrosyl-tRNA synthetase
VGGSDQWGNIIAGIDLCQKASSSKVVFGLTVPLLLSPSGEKFGKSVGNALFLDPNSTHPFDLYQVF